MCCAVVKKKKDFFCVIGFLSVLGLLGCNLHFWIARNKCCKNLKEFFLKKKLSLAVLPGCPWLSSGEDKFFIVKSQVSGILSIFGVLVRKLHIWIDHNMLYKNLKEFYKNVEV